MRPRKYDGRNGQNQRRYESLPMGRERERTPASKQPEKSLVGLRSGIPQDTRNRHDPRLKDIPATMAVFSRNQRREEFDNTFREVMPEIDSVAWQPAHDPED